MRFRILIKNNDQTGKKKQNLPGFWKNRLSIFHNRVGCFIFALFFPTFCIFAQNAIFRTPEEFSLKSFQTIEERFSPPSGFKRVSVVENSFASFLKKLPLLPVGSDVIDFKGHIRVAAKDSSVAAVSAYAIKGRRLDQCMDIILRLYSAWMFQSGQSDFIVFPLPEGTLLSWRDWASGIRPVFKGLHFLLVRRSSPDSSAKSFDRYQNTIFNYSNTQSFYYHYKPFATDSLCPGDFIVKKGPKGHAVLIVDLAENENGNRVALFAQGDTPACALYILAFSKDSPWVPLNPADPFPHLPIRKKMFWDGLRRFPVNSKLPKTNTK